MNACGSQLLCDESRYPSLSEQLKAIKKHGFAAVDICAFESWGKGLSTSRLSDDDGYFRQTVKTIRRSRMETPSINCAPGPNLLSTDATEVDLYTRQIAAVVRLAEEIGAVTITTQAPKAPTGWELGRTEVEYVQRWRRVVEAVAPPESIRFASEVHSGTFLEQPTSALRVAKELFPAVGVTYDPSHQVMIGVPLQDTLPLLQYTYQVHLRDARPKEMQAVFGEGTVDFQWVLSHLVKAGYDGPISVEYFGDFDPGFTSARKLKEAIESF